MGMVLDKASMQYSLDETDYRGEILEAYERLLRDAMSGDRTLFTTAKGIERLWEISTPLLESPPPVKPYPSGSWGPSEIGALISPHGWRLPCARRWRQTARAAGNGARADAAESPRPLR
jgi:glucose-6-phosphate 1-dehydrogenase